MFPQLSVSSHICFLNYLSHLPYSPLPFSPYIHLLLYLFPHCSPITLLIFGTLCSQGQDHLNKIGDYLKCCHCITVHKLSFHSTPINTSELVNCLSKYFFMQAINFFINSWSLVESVRVCLERSWQFAVVGKCAVFNEARSARHSCSFYSFFLFFFQGQYS